MDIGCWLLDICTFNTRFLSLRTVRGARRNKHHKGDMNMSTTILDEWTGYGLANGVFANFVRSQRFFSRGDAERRRLKHDGK